MKKLTAEQAEELIAKFRVEGLGENPAGGYYILNLQNVINIINYFTEEDFPVFYLPHDSCCSTSVDLANEADWGKNVISIHHKNIETESEHEHFYDFKEFKAFTNGCVKICEWLEDKE